LIFWQVFNPNLQALLASDSRVGNIS
jgi:hypothetical protein